VNQQERCGSLPVGVRGFPEHAVVAHPAQRLDAIKEILDRIEGRPAQSVTISQGVTNEQAVRVLELYNKLENGGKDVGLPINKPN